MRRTSPATMASIKGCRRVARRWSLALPAAITAHTASSLPACITPSTTSLYPPSPLTETISGRPVCAACRARVLAWPACSVGCMCTVTSGNRSASSVRNCSASRGASPVLCGLKTTITRSKLVTG